MQRRYRFGVDLLGMRDVSRSGPEQDLSGGGAAFETAVGFGGLGDLLHRT